MNTKIEHSRGLTNPEVYLLTLPEKVPQNSQHTAKKENLSHLSLLNESNYKNQ